MSIVKQKEKDHINDLAFLGDNSNNKALPPTNGS